MGARILKHLVPVDDQPHPIGGGLIVHIDRSPDDVMVGRVDRVAVWTLEDEERPAPDRVVRVYSTGEYLPETSRPLGTVVAGEYAWHLLELTEEATG